MRKKLTVAKLRKILTGTHSNIGRVVLYFLLLIIYLDQNLSLGAIFILRKDIRVDWWSRKWQFSLTLSSENVLT